MLWILLGVGYAVFGVAGPVLVLVGAGLLDRRQRAEWIETQARLRAARAAAMTAAAVLTPDCPLPGEVPDREQCDLSRYEDAVFWRLVAAMQVPIIRGWEDQL